MKKLLVMTLAGALGGQPLCVGADESLRPVSDMFIKGIVQHDFVLVSNAALRCGSLVLMVGELTDRDTPDIDVASGLSELGGGLSTMGMYTAAAVFKHRGMEVDWEDVQQRSLDMTDRYTKTYMNRMSQNQISDGQMFAEDELITADLDFCPSMRILFTDEWAETIGSNDWSYWDELFAE